MCLIISNKKHPDYEPTVAKDNILVYKLLKRECSELLTPYRYFHIEFINGICSMSANMLCHIFVTHNVTEGIHAFFNKNIALCESRHYGYNTFYAIIPKGTKYYVGVDFDIVAENMIIFNRKRAFNNWIKKGNTITEIDY